MTRLFRYAATVALFSGLATGQVMAQATSFNAPYSSVPVQPTNKTAPSTDSDKQIHGGEHFRARGHRTPPPGYQDTPSTDFQHGPDPDHLAGVERDNVTGANLSKFGSSYQGSSNVQSGQLGDATGNGWVAPKGNGW
ncbi:hypothetical protein AA106555_1283 [Neokomagataea thailandica NBRC 106555]|uniref:Uncharacterized protein n=2 Tax=Neokomagataea TaxID=1223423 RepID=A0A4Y6V558_9PROT|nr:MULTISPECIES: hypothetical protein [Neokomagataea]QDH25189.1 hypothetical protein D5366_08175 [Neokomagataea tanensis]GBR53403.1 hypothetical protein AA106555_1283 [Neokomagataea thailandica NBRC 106555]